MRLRTVSGCPSRPAQDDRAGSQCRAAEDAPTHDVRPAVDNFCQNEKETQHDRHNSGGRL